MILRWLPIWGAMALAAPVAAQEYVAEILSLPQPRGAEAVAFDGQTVAGRYTFRESFLLTTGGYLRLGGPGVISSGVTDVRGDLASGVLGNDGGLWERGVFRSLAPAGAYATSVQSLTGPSLQGGYINEFPLGDNIPALWRGTPESYVRMLPAGWWSGAIKGVSDQVQVGSAAGPIGHGACVWYGTPESALLIHPPGYAGSSAFAIGGSQVVGSAYVRGTTYHALLWVAPAWVWVDLNPTGATWSTAYDTNGRDQCGAIVTAGVMRATVWRGSPESFTDLHRLLPARMFRGSQARAIDVAGNILGHAEDMRGYSRIVLWRRT